MVLYCSGHESTVLRMLVHKLTYHKDEEIVYVTTKGTYPFSESKKDFSKIYKAVIEINTAFGKNLDDEEKIVGTICNILDEAFAKNKIDINAFSEIYVTEDLYVPFTIYFETKGIAYNTIEISPYAFENKRKHTVEKELYSRTVTYFNLSKRLGAFEGTGKYCKKRIFDIGSVNSYTDIQKNEYDYVKCIADLSDNDREAFFYLYSIPKKLRTPANISLVLTNSRGYIQGNFPNITPEMIPDIYMKIFDYYIDNPYTFLKPHPNSNGINYASLFTEERIIDDKFLVDLIPFIPGITLDRVINVCSTSSALLSKYCNQLDVLDSSFYSFYTRLPIYCAILDMMNQTNYKPKKIYVQIQDAKQVKVLMKIKEIDIDVADISQVSGELSDSLAIIIEKKTEDYAILKRTSFVNGKNNAVIVYNDAKNVLNKSSIANPNANIDRLVRTETTKNGDVVSEDTFLIYSDNKEMFNEFIFEKALLHSGNKVKIALTKEKICVFGGTAVRNLSSILGNEYNVEYLPYISVLSVLSEKNDDLSDNLTDDANVSLKCDIQKNLSDYISQCKAFVFDLETLRYNLFEYKSTLYSQTCFLDEYSFYKENKDRFVNIDPMNLPAEEIRNRLNVFLECIEKAFEKEKIILVRHGECEYSEVNGIIKKNNGVNTNYNMFVKKWEDYVVDRLQCSSINIWSKYFSQDEHRKKIYEYTFHVDVAKKIKEILLYGIHSECDSPDYELTLRRYIKNFDCRTNQITRGLLFFNRNNWAQNIVRLMSADFIEKNISQILCVLGNGYNKLSCIMNHNTLTDEFKKVFIALNDITNNVIKEDTDYSVICREDYMAIREMCPLIEKLYSDNGGGNIKADYKSVYFYILGYQRYLTNNKNWDIELIKRITAQMPELHLLDWWGSCISRECLNYGKHLEINKSLARNPLTHISSPKIIYNDDYMKEDQFISGYIHRCVKNECDRTAFDYFRDSESEWIIMDIFNDLSLYINYIDNRNKGLFCKMLNCDQGTPFFDEIFKNLSPYDITLQSDEYILDLCKDAIEFLAEKYGKNVIIIKSHWNDYYLNEKNDLCLMPKNDLIDITYHKRLNHVGSLMEKNIQSSLGCYYIAYTNQYFSKIPWIGDGEILPVHYENEFYYDTVGLVENIVKYSPRQKVYTDRDPGSKISRIISLPSNEYNNRILHNKFANNFMDHVIIELDRKVLGEYKDVIVEIYDRDYFDLKSVLDQFPFVRYKAQKLEEELLKIYREE